MINSIVTCVWCHQQNRVPANWTPGKKLRCGSCKGPVAVPDDSPAPYPFDVEDDEDEDDEDEAFDIEGGQE